MGSTLNSIDNMLSASANYGYWSRSLVLNCAATTAATATSGYTTAKRYPVGFSAPPITATLSGTYVTYLRMFPSATGLTLAALEYTLGSLTLASGIVFRAGNAMPSKLVRGNIVQTASVMPVLVIARYLNLTAASPVITITYTNQAGVGSRTASMTLPTNSIANSVFNMAPYLQSGDTGVQSVQNITSSAGTVGVINVLGLLPLNWNTLTTSTYGTMDTVTLTHPMFRMEQQDTIGFYHFGSNALTTMMVAIGGVGD